MIQRRYCHDIPKTKKIYSRNNGLLQYATKDRPSPKGVNLQGVYHD
jgi:hypothetical protein